MLRPTPGDPWGVEQHHWNTGAIENQQLNPGERHLVIYIQKNAYSTNLLQRFEFYVIVFIQDDVILCNPKELASLLFLFIVYPCKGLVHEVTARSHFVGCLAVIHLL